MITIQQFQGDIYITEEGENPAVLVHEAAHSLLVHLDPIFPFEWILNLWDGTNFRKPLHELGILDSYALKGPLSDEELELRQKELSQILNRYEVKTFHREGISINIYNCNPDSRDWLTGRTNAQEIAEKMFEQHLDLPGRLKSFVPEINVLGYEGTPWKGAFSPPHNTSSAHNLIAEDVATHTHIFYQLLERLRDSSYRLTDKDKSRLETYCNNPNAQKRAELLTREGFLEEHFPEKLMELQAKQERTRTHIIFPYHSSRIFLK